MFRLDTLLMESWRGLKRGKNHTQMVEIRKGWKGRGLFGSSALGVSTFVRYKITTCSSSSWGGGKWPLILNEESSPALRSICLPWNACTCLCWYMALFSKIQFPHQCNRIMQFKTILSFSIKYYSAFTMLLHLLLIFIQFLISIVKLLRAT